MHVLVMAPPAAPLGHGRSGGITRHIDMTCAALGLCGHRVTVLAPEGSHLPGRPVMGLAGTLHASLAAASGKTSDREGYVIPADSVLAAMWRWAKVHQAEYHLILNFAHDWLPYFVTDFFTTPIAHIANMGDVNAATTREMARLSAGRPGCVAVLSKAQAARLEGLVQPYLLSFGFDLSAYPFVETPGLFLVWAGRISPEKGLEDALAIAAALGERLVIAGAVDNPLYWQALQVRYGTVIDYRGFLSGPELAAVLGQGRALLQTQVWHEAFGIVTAEALACGTPVIAYARGANTELVEDGVTGFLVPPGDQQAACRRVADLSRLSRRACRQAAEQRFSLSAYAGRLNDWLSSPCFASSVRRGEGA